MKEYTDSWECPYCDEFNNINMNEFNENESRIIKCNYCHKEITVNVYVDKFDLLDDIYRKRFSIQYWDELVK